MRTTLTLIMTACAALCMGAAPEKIDRLLLGGPADGGGHRVTNVADVVTAGGASLTGTAAAVAGLGTAAGMNIATSPAQWGEGYLAETADDSDTVDSIVYVGADGRLRRGNTDEVAEFLGLPESFGTMALVSTGDYVRVGAPLTNNWVPFTSTLVSAGRADTTGNGLYLMLANSTNMYSYSYGGPAFLLLGGSSSVVTKVRSRIGSSGADTNVTMRLIRYSALFNTATTNVLSTTTNVAVTVTAGKPNVYVWSTTLAFSAFEQMRFEVQNDMTNGFYASVVLVEGVRLP